MISRDEIYQKAAEAKVDPSIVEKDYHLGIALKTIAEYQKTKDWVFRGGTALKKCYFPDYRFSEDLDFTLLDRTLGMDEKIKEVLEEICTLSNQRFGTTLEFFKVSQEREEYGEEAFKGTLHFQSIKGKSKVKIDLSFVDKIFIEPKTRNIIHGYSDSNIFGSPRIRTATLEEIISDKLMAVAFIRTYPRTRDMFDIWYISKNKKLDLKLVRDTIEKKCEYRKLDKSLLYKIDQKHLEKFRKYWRAQLAALTGDLPEFEEVVDGVVVYRDKVLKANAL